MVEGRAIYAVAAVERILGESADTIHGWEARYGLPTPSRSPGGQLLYTRDDVERLRWIAHGGRGTAGARVLGRGRTGHPGAAGRA